MQWKEMCGQYLRTTVVSYGNFVLAPVMPDHPVRAQVSRRAR